MLHLNFDETTYVNKMNFLDFHVGNKRGVWFRSK